MLDVCFGDSECGALKLALGKSDVTFSFRNLELGQIADKNFANSRKQWIDIMFATCSEQERKKLQAEEVTRFEEIIATAKGGEPLRIWHASSPCSKSGYYHLIFHLQGIDCTIYTVELPDDAPGYRGADCDRSWGEIEVSDIEKYLVLQKVLTVEERNILVGKWAKLATENADLRLNVNRELTSVPEDYLDEEILNCAPQGKYRLIRHISAVLETSPHGINDCFVARRIEHLIQSGKIILLKRSKGEKYYAETFLKKAIPSDR